MFPRSAPVLGVLFAAALSLPLHADTFVEDFSTMANGGGDKPNIREGEANGWSGRGLESWAVEDSSLHQKKVLKSLTGLPNWHPLGHPHGLDLAGVKSLEVFMTVVQSKSHSANWVWLADESQNGYGVEYSGFNRRLRIFKIRNCNAPFADARDISAWICEIAKTPSGDETKIIDPIDEDSLVTLHLRVEQEKPGGPVTLTAWNVNDSTGVSASYESPLEQVIDDGSGSTFGSENDGSGPVFDLSALTFLAFTAETAKDGLPVFVKVGAETSKGAAPATAAKR